MSNINVLWVDDKPFPELEKRAKKNNITLERAKNSTIGKDALHENILKWDFVLLDGRGTKEGSVEDLKGCGEMLAELKRLEPIRHIPCCIFSAYAEEQDLKILKDLYGDVKVFSKIEDEDASSFDSRNINKVLTSDKIVCVGFSSLLKCLCNKLGIEGELESLQLKNKETNEIVGHSAFCVKIKDPKYDLNGIFFADPTADCLSEKIKTTRSSFALIPYDQITNVYNQYDATILETYDGYGFVRRQLFDNDEIKIKDKLCEAIKKNISKGIEENINIDELYTKSISDDKINIKYLKNSIIYSFKIGDLQEKIIHAQKDQSISKIISEHIDSIIPNIKETIELSFFTDNISIDQMKGKKNVR